MQTPYGGHNSFDPVEDGPFFWNCTQSPVILVADEDILVHSVLSVADRLDLYYPADALWTKSAGELSEGPFHLSHIGKDLSLDDDLGVGWKLCESFSETDKANIFDALG